MIHGILNVYKEKGYTSHDVVAKLRGILGQRKIGHTGTLDPDAEGVLPVCLGKATKLCDMLTDKDKCYETVMLLGKETDTQDISGTVVQERDTRELTEEEVIRAAKQFQGGYDQVPPMYSALKVNGKKLYELAREGKVVERKARRVEIYQIEILETALPRVRMRIHCSKGTYIRTLCHDIGALLGCGACMEKLLRTKVSCFLLEDAYTLDEIREKKEEEQLREILIPADRLFEAYPEGIVQEEWEKQAYNGHTLPAEAVSVSPKPQDGADVRIYDGNRQFIGIYQYTPDEGYKIRKMFYVAEENGSCIM